MTMLHYPREGQTAGYTTLAGPDAGMTEGVTLQCAHCGMHWQAQPGSGRQRGWCFKCAAPSCGKRVCESECVPQEKWLEIWEGSRKLDAALERIRGL